MINQVTLVGRLTKDPDLRITPEGTPVVNVILAVNRQFKNQHGDYETDFVHCTLWRKTAENTATFCRKGAVIGITGKIHTRNYTNQEGKKVYVTEVVAESVQFLSKKPSSNDRNTNGEWNPPNESTTTSNSNPQNTQPPSGDWPNTTPKEESNVTAAGIF
jgi:single-strand DNA-binding protein